MFEFISTWFQAIWSLFGIDYPGFGFSIGSIALGALAATLGLRILGKIAGASFNLDTTFRGMRGTVRGGNNRRIKINERRRGDEH